MLQVVADKNITTNFGLNLIEVRPHVKEAIFQKVGGSPDETVSFEVGQRLVHS